MMTVKIGMFPGRINEYAIENGTTVAEALELAGIEVTSEQEIKFDGRSMSGNDVLTKDGTLIVTKRIKGNK